MTKTTLTLYGLPTEIRYHVHGPGRLEWHLEHADQELSFAELLLLEHLLRTHENKTITDMLWDEHQAMVYEKDARAAAAAEDYNPF